MDATQPTTTFALYQEAWLAYVGVILLFLLLIWWLIRKWNGYVQAVLLSSLAAGALTPVTQSVDAQTYAPAIIVMMLEAEQHGVQGLQRGGFAILIAWAVLLVLGCGLTWWMRNRRHVSKAAPEQDSSMQAASVRSRPSK